MCPWTVDTNTNKRLNLYATTFVGFGTDGSATVVRKSVLSPGHVAMSYCAVPFYAVRCGVVSCCFVLSGVVWYGVLLCGMVLSCVV